MTISCVQGNAAKKILHVINKKITGQIIPVRGRGEKWQPSGERIVTKVQVSLTVEQIN